MVAITNKKPTTDEDGFLVLDWKKHQNDKPKKVKKPKKKKKKSKGIMKAWVLRLLNSCVPSKMVEKFHDTRMENIVIYDKHDVPHTIRYKGHMDKALFKKIKNKYPDAYVLINGGDGFYSKVSVDTYVKMSKISRVVVHFELHATLDGRDDDDQRNVISPIDRVIDSVNELVRFHMSERTRVDTIMDMCCCEFWYDMFDSDYRIAVLYNDGTEDYFKYINDFFNKLGLSPI